MKFMTIATTAVILAGGLVGGSYMLSKFQLNLKKEELTRGYIVKGYASKNAISDIGMCRLTLSINGATVNECYEKLDLAKGKLLALINTAGFTDSEVELGTIYTHETNKRDEKGNYSNIIEYYTMNLPIKVTSSKVNSIKTLPQLTSTLYKSGVMISNSRPEFYISNIDDIKNETLAAATANARDRALTLANNGGGKVGELRRAHQGVFQVTEPLSTETSSLGEYNTDTIEKAVKAVVSIEYQLAE